MIYKSRWQKQCERNVKWHNWFAWYPVTVDGKKAWLQIVQRRWCFVPRMLGHVTEYRIRK